MKSKLITATLWISCFHVINTVNAQSEIEIDPRQYVTVMYKKTPNSGILDTIWNWDKRKNVPYQKFYFLDIDGGIKIVFDKGNLSTNKDFEGTFSLEAEISGSSGTRRIEVNPFSEIGVQRRPVGIKSEPPTIIAGKLLNILRELNTNHDNNTNTIYISNPEKYLQSELQNFFLFKNEINTDISDIQKNLKDGPFDTLLVLNKAKNIVSKVLDVYSPIYYYLADTNSVKTSLKTFESFRNSDYFLKQLTNVQKAIALAIDQRESGYFRELKSMYDYVTPKLNLLINYLNSFEASGADALKAFLSLINKDFINYSGLKSELIRLQDNLKKIQLPTNFDTAKQILFNNIDLIVETNASLTALARFQGSRLEKVIDSFISKEMNPTKYDNPSEKIIHALDTYGDDLINIISVEAARIIYKKLVYATIDLGKSGAKEGEVLNVYVTWILDGKDSLANSPRLPIGKYYLRETGWKVEVADMFALIKRINEKNADQSKISPSNFKGSGGAVLMWTYRGEDKGVNISIDKEKTIVSDTAFAVKNRNKFWNFLQPSIGLNVSYLDFSTDKDVEIGTGLQLGLFRNKIFFGYGYNLHMLKDKPRYFFIGFSFAKLDDLFKGNGSIKSIGNLL